MPQLGRLSIKKNLTCLAEANMLKMRLTLALSIVLNSLLAGLFGYLLVRTGGCDNLRQRLNHSEAGLATHRANLFSSLPAQPNAIIFLGDTYTQQAEWHELLQTDLPVCNRGIIGEIIDSTLARVPDIIRHQPSAVVICIGMQDLLQERPFSQIEKSYFDLVKNLQQKVPTSLLVITSLPPVNELLQPDGLNNQKIRELNIRIQQIARNQEIPYLDLFSKLTDQNGNLSTQFSNEGLSLNAEAYQTWKNLLSPILDQLNYPSPIIPDTLK